MRCPHCHEKIESLNYTCDTTEYSKESGFCDLNFEDHEFSDANTYNSKSDNFYYFCPECGEEINDGELLEDEEEKEIRIETADDFNKIALKNL